MDLPVFHLDFFGNRFLIAWIAIVHVFINHPMAVGAIPIITLMEWWGKRTGDSRWDQLAYRLLTVCFIITTSVGALTGVGIWVSTSLVNPYAIGSLIRVFYWAWFSEWIVFCAEVGLILVYFLTWKKWQGDNKNLHIAVGACLAVASWLTMAIIVAILGYMMDIGNWTEEKNILVAIMNPIYLPQLAFRTPLAMMTGGLFMMFLTYFFTYKKSDFQVSACRWISTWSLAWLPFCLLGGLWYWHSVPAAMADNLRVALATQAFESRYGMILDLLLTGVMITFLTLLWGIVKPTRLPRFALLIPFLIALMTLGFFERTREFIRKPYVIGDYMYANGIQVKEYPLLQQRGILSQSSYFHIPEITDDNKLEAGRDVFMIACTRCHTTHGVNGILSKFETLYGAQAWDEEMMKIYIEQMHNVRPFMPPFPGNQAELDALVQYIQSLRRFPVPVKGAQTAIGDDQSVSNHSS